MSDEMSGLVWTRFPGKGGELIVMLALADWSNDNGHAYGKMSTLGRKSRMTKRNAQIVVDHLEAKKWVKVVRHAVNGWANDFYLNKRKLESQPPITSQADDEQIPRVKNFHPSGQRKLGFPQKGENCGKRRVKNSTNMGEIVEKNREKISPHVMTSHDMTMTGSHDHATATVENSEKDSQQKGFEFDTDHNEQQQNSPSNFARRITLIDGDDGGAFGAEELVAAYLLITKNSERKREGKSDIEVARRLMKIPFSLAAFQWLIEVQMGWATEHPGSLKYFERGVQQLWVRCEDAIIDATRDSEKSFAESVELIQEVARREIEIWYHAKGTREARS